MDEQAAAQPHSAPRRLGEFEVHSILGRGGMGVVYRAWDPALRRQVALKVMGPCPSAERRARFRREGQLAATLDHPGIVRVHSAGEVNGSPYLACELVEGCRTLGAVLPELDPRRRVELVRDAARALGHAHARGVVHRDVKPDNLLVDAAGTLRVTDFGVATGRDVERLTQSGAFVGTPGYMPPEQLSASVDGLDPRADVWALGVVLYEALTGTLPFEVTNLQLYIHLVLHGDPQPPSARVASVPRALDAICLRALASHPGDRYADGDALADALDGWLQGRPLASRRRPLAAVAVGAVVIAAALVAASSRPPVTPSRALSTESVVETASAPPPPPPSVEDAAEAARQLRRASRLTDPSQRLAAAREWLARWPGNRDREAALELERRARPLVATVLEAPRGTTQVRFLDDRRLVVGAADGVWVLDAETGRALSRLSSLPVRGRLRELPGGGVIILDGPDVVVVAPDATTLGTFRLDPDVTCFDVSEDGRVLAAGLESGSVQVVALPDGRPLRRLEGHRHAVKSVCLSRDGRWAATGTGLTGPIVPGVETDNSARLWDLETGALVRRITNASRANAVELLRGGDALLVGTSGGRVLLYPTQEAAEAITFGADEGGVAPLVAVAHGAGVAIIVASPDGRRAYSVSDGELRAWDVDAGRERYAILRARDFDTLDLSPDGTRLVTCSDGELEVWATE